MRMFKFKHESIEYYNEKRFFFLHFSAYSWYGVIQTWLDADSHITKILADSTNSTCATMGQGKFILPETGL